MSLTEVAEGHQHEYDPSERTTDPPTNDATGHMHPLAPGELVTGVGGEDRHVHELPVAPKASGEKVEPPLEEFDALQDESTASIAMALDAMAIAILEQDSASFMQAATDYAEQLTRARQLSDMLGRRRLLMESDAKGGMPELRRLRSFMAAAATRGLVRQFAASPWVSKVTFEEAITSLLQREPRLAAGWEAVQLAYTTQNAFVLARSASVVLTEKIQLLIAKSMAKGTVATESEAVAQILAAARSEGQSFTRAYAGTVYRTNLTTAYTAGRIKQAEDPAVRAVTPGFRYDSVGDVDTRHNHQAADGVVALQGDPIWRELSPPLGYNCRCVLALATNAEVRAAQASGKINARGLARKPRGAGADEGFVKLGRTDMEVYPGGAL